jgi:hypothetical protein
MVQLTGPDPHRTRPAVGWHRPRATPFQITAVDYAGRHDGEVTIEMALESAGALAFAAWCWAQEREIR